MTAKELKEKTNGVILNVLITEKGSQMSVENRFLLEVATDASRRSRPKSRRLSAFTFSRSAPPT